MSKINLDVFYLLSGLPIPIENIQIHHPKLKEMAHITEPKFNEITNLLIFDAEALKEEKGIEEDVVTFDFIQFTCIGDVNFRNKIQEGLSFYTKESVIFDKEALHFIVGKKEYNKIICRDNYEMIKQAIKIVSCFGSSEEKKEVKPYNEQAAKIMEQQRLAKEKIRKIKGGDFEQKVSLCDLVSAYSATQKKRPSEVYEYTLYEFVDQFHRYQALEDYMIKIKSLLAGADPKQVDIQHYIYKK